MQSILEDFSKTEFDSDAVEGAKSAVIFTLVSEVDTVPLAADNAFLTYLSQSPIPKMIQEVLAVKPEDLIRVLKTRLINLFDPSKSLTAVAVNPAKIEDTQKLFGQLGVELEIIEDIEGYLTSEKEKEERKEGGKEKERGKEKEKEKGKGKGKEKE